MQSLSTRQSSEYSGTVMYRSVSPREVCIAISDDVIFSERIKFASLLACEYIYFAQRPFSLRIRHIQSEFDNIT